MDFSAGLLEMARPAGPNSKRDFKGMALLQVLSLRNIQNSCFCTDPGAKTPTHEVMHGT